MPSSPPQADSPPPAAGPSLAITDERADPAEILDLFVAAGYAAANDEASLRLLTTALAHSNVIVTARSASRLVGVARGWSDFAAIAYLADIAVHAQCRRRGIGSALVETFKRSAGGGDVKLLLLSRTESDGFYRRLGFEPVPEALQVPSG